MKYFFALCAILTTTAAVAGVQNDLPKAPNAFTSKKGRAVFVDFVSANYKLVYDVKKGEASVVSSITFIQSQKGLPIFDLTDEPAKVSLDGSPVETAKIKDPDDQTSYRLVLRPLKAGEHKLVVKHVFDKNTKFSNGEAASGFWMSDLTDRHYLEQYLPTNLEYDQYQMSFEVSVVNTDKEHEVFANGKIQELGKNKFAVVYPEYFTSSSLYFHLSAKNRFHKKEFSFTSMNGKVVPALAYSKRSWSLGNIKEKVLAILNELEEKFGPWGHPSLTIYIAGSGGMEHSGATITSLFALGHELTHSYFARGVMPVDGNSGWLDEAIASWRDDGYDSDQEPFYTSAKMAGFSEYKRTTDRKAYSEGAGFMAYLNHELAEQGGLAAFLSGLYENYARKNVSTEIFQKELASFSGKNFDEDFARYVYGERKDSPTGQIDNAEKRRDGRSFRPAPKSNPYHPRLSEKDLRELL